MEAILILAIEVHKWAHGSIHSELVLRRRTIMPTQTEGGVLQLV